MVNRIKKGTWTKIFKWFTEDQVKIPDVNVPSDEKLIISQQNSTYWKDNKVDNIIASQYLDVKDKTTETYVDKIGMETGIYADIQNIDSKILDTYRILWMPDNDIFSRQDISSQEKVAMSTERRNISSNRISQLRKLQQAKQSEIKELAEFEASKAKAQTEANKQAILYRKQLMDEQKLWLEERKFWLTIWKAEEDINLKRKQFNLSVDKFGLDESKFIASEVKDSDLIIWDFWKVDVWGKYWTWNVTQTYGTSSVLPSDNVQLASGKVWTPGIDLAGTLWDNISAFEWWKIVSVTSWQTNIPKDKWGETGWSYWNQIVIEDVRWQLHYYNHLESVWNYKEWQAIQKGQLIGTMWNTGTSTGVHLDYRVKSDKWWEDPRNYLTKKWDKKSEGLLFDNSFDYLNSTISNVAKKISTDTAEKIMISDMESFDMPKTKIKQLQDLWKIDNDLVNEYNSLKRSKNISTLSDDVIVEKLWKIDFANMSDEQRLKALVDLALAWKLNYWDDELFEWGWLDFDEPWYEAIVDYFDDVQASMESANNIATEIKKKYNLK